MKGHLRTLFLRFRHAPLTRRYKAFISYKHATSRTFAVELESALKAYARPLLRPPIPIFRDEKILRVGDDLPTLIRKALDASEYLILVASPAAAVSPWVADELRQWCGTLKRTDRLIIVLTEGEISVDDETRRIRWAETTALPTLLSEHLTSLPLWVDLRGMSDKDWSLENLRFTDAVNSISARLREVTPEEMNDEHVLQHRRNIRLRNGAVTLISVMLAVSIIASVLLWLSRQELSRALGEVVRQRNTSESRRLAGLSAVERTGGRLDVAALLASEGLQFADTTEARSSLLASLQQFVGKEAILPCADCKISELSFRQTEELLSRALIAIGTTRGDVLVRDLSRIGPFVPTSPPMHRAAINSMAFNPAGTLLASAGVGADSQLVVWKVGDSFADPLIEPVEVHEGIGWAVAFSPDGRRLASVRADGSVLLGDVSTDGIRFQQSMHGHRGLIFTVAFSPDGRRLASAGMDGTVRIWDVAKGAPALEPLRGHHGAVGRVAFSPDGRLLASAGHDGTVRLWDTASGEPSGEPLAGHRDLVASVDFAPDGATLASSGRDGSIFLWDVEVRQRAGEPLLSHRGAVGRALFISAHNNASRTPLFDGSLLASAGDDGNVILWRLKGSGHLFRTIAPGETPVEAIAFGGKGRVMAVAANHTIQFLNPESGAMIGKSIDVRENVAALAQSADGALFASAHLDGTVQLWDASSQTQRGLPLIGHDGFAHDVAFSPDNQRLASAGQNGVIVWDLATGRPVHDLMTEHVGDVYCIAYSPDGRLLVSGGRDGTIVVRDSVTLKIAGEPLRGHLEGVTGIAFDRSSELLVSGSFDGTVRVWRLPQGDALGSPLRLTGAAVHTISLSPDGSTIAAGAADGTITLWNLAERQVIGSPLRSHRAAVRSLSFSADGHFLGSAAGDGPAVLWTVDSRAWKALAEQLVRRNLTREEWVRFVGPETPYRPTFTSWPLH